MTYKNKNSADALKHLIWGLVFKGVLKAYKQVKQHYFENNKETLFIELKSQEDEIEKLKLENKLNKDKISQLTEKIRIAKAEAEQMYIGRIRELEAEIKQLRSSLAEERQKEQELVALRELFFSLDQGIVPETDEQVPDLSNTTGAIVGGHTRWHQRLKEFLPQWVFISSETFDTRVLDGIEVICFFTQHMSHSLYYKAIMEARKRNLRIGYIRSLNEKLALKEIGTVLKG
jgi:seryl-tRNA synthetase